MNDWFHSITKFITDVFTLDGFAYRVLCLPERAAVGAKPIDDLMVWVHWLMLVLFVGWILYFGYALWRFNVRRNAKASYEGSKSSMPKYVEFAIVGIEAVLLLGVAIPLWGKNVQNFPEPKDATVVQIMAQQYSWNARYPGLDGVFGQQDMKLIAHDNTFGVDSKDEKGKDDIVVLNEIHVEVDKPVLIYLSSKDVIHSLKLVAMRVTQDAIPGLRIPMTFTPTKVGRFQIECAQLCGGGHAAMAGGFIIVDSKDDFAKWIKSKSGAAQSYE
jgi:cytochrome c oxidase subunit II